MRAVVEHVYRVGERAERSGSRTLTIREGARNDTISPRSREEEIGQSRERIRQHRKQDRRHHQSQSSRKVRANKNKCIKPLLTGPLEDSDERRALGNVT
jgi:hypothetical protein